MFKEAAIPDKRITDRVLKEAKRFLDSSHYFDSAEFMIERDRREQIREMILVVVEAALMEQQRPHSEWSYLDIYKDFFNSLIEWGIEPRVSVSIIMNLSALIYFCLDREKALRLEHKEPEPITLEEIRAVFGNEEEQLF